MVKRQYILNVSVESEDDIEEMEELLQDILLDLYDVDSVDKIHVIDNNSKIPNDDSLEELLNIIDEVGAREVMRSIELVREMESDDYE